MPHSVLLTVSDHCTPTIRGEDDDFHVPLLMYAAPPCDYKRGRRASFKGGRFSEHQRPSHPHSRSSHSSQPTPFLVETWELPSLTRLACTSYYEHSGCKIIQCPRTPLCWTYGPAAGIRINRALLCCLLYQLMGRGNTQHLLVGIQTPHRQ